MVESSQRTRARDSDAASAAEARYELLLEASRLLAQVLDLEKMLTGLADLVVPRFADWCSVDLVDSRGRFSKSVVSHINPDNVGIAYELRRRYAPSASAPGLGAVLATGAAQLYSDVDERTVASWSRDPEHVALLQALGICSAIVVPLKSRGRTLGVVAIVSNRPSRRYENRDLELIEKLAERVAAALDNAELLANEHSTRIVAELNAERLARLQSVTAALSQAITPADVIDVALTQAAPAIDGRHAALLLLSDDGKRLGVVDSRHAPHRESAPADIAADSVWPPLEALRERQPLFLESAPPALPGSALLGDVLLDGALAALPLISEERPLGVLVIGFPGPRAFDAGDRAFMLTLARQCAQALDRARLFEAGTKTSNRMRLLAEASELLATSLDYDTTLQNVAALAMPTLADFCFFDVVEQAGVRRISRAFQDPETQALLETTHWVRSERTDINVCALSSGQPGFHPHVDQAWYENIAANEHHLQLLQQLAFCSLITVPLSHVGSVVGSLTLCYAGSRRHHTLDDLHLAQELARRAAVAVDNAKLYRAAREATEDARLANSKWEEASRTKDQFLGVVSHELRTPLNAILGWAQLLKQNRGDLKLLDKGLDVIVRNVQAQVRIIEDILDVSRIISGRLRVETAPVSLEAVVRGAAEIVRPAAHAKQIDVTIAVPGPVAPVAGDADRLQQVVWNLLSNAVKFSPPKSRVEIRLEQQGDRACVSVADSGEGIAEDFLPHMFERFRQADSSPSRRHGGLGLGLAIVRHLVELHGGTVRAESLGRGKGARFRIEIPVARDVTPEQAAPAPRSEPSRARRLQGARIVVVDDDPDTLAVAGETFKALGAHVVCVDRAARAVDVLRDEPADILVSDLGLPQQDGFDLIQEVRALATPNGRIPALALTAYSGAEVLARAKALGYDAYLVKPVDPEQLVEAIGALLPRR